ncbi:MAG: type I 3-dehydroquinate dehydratase [Bacteroidales bacterium]|nr:type I 3-dehydroquinate dehydratase [Bacteroidales bacterium]
MIKKFELSEIRLDLCQFDKTQIEKIFSSGQKLIATCRPSPSMNENERLEILLTAIRSGAKYVDVEIETDYSLKQKIISEAIMRECDVIISYHNFDYTPTLEQLKIIVNQCFDMGANVAKVACMVREPSDNARLLALYHNGKRIVALGMGELGKISRIAAPFLGAEFTFASANDEFSTAPGQISYHKLNTIIELLKNS